MSFQDKTTLKMEPIAQIWCGISQHKLTDNNMYLF